jgi:hypothetical protein
MNHLFVICSFNNVVWKEVLQRFKLKNIWDKNSLLECFNSWITNRSITSYKALPCCVLWGGGECLARNRRTFQGKEEQLGWLTHQIRISYGEGWKPPKKKGPRRL